MGQNGRYRHELKYMIEYQQYLELKSRIKAVMQTDTHAGEDGKYKIQSIYFDNLSDKALREKIDGTAKREKFRIRYYNNDFSLIMLEKKMKYGNLCMKFSARITEEECRSLLHGQISWMLRHPSSLVNELYVKMRGQLLRPRVLVSYIREPYIYKAGNVRITFDSDIRTTLYHRKFLEYDVCDVPAADDPQELILEIKYDAFLPEIIENIIQTSRIRQQAFSKYSAGRRFG